MANDPSPFNDPFGSQDSARTFIKPSPGGWASSRTQSPVPPPPEAPEPAQALTGLSPLLELANPLLMLATRLRHARQMDPGLLRTSLVQGIRDFASAAQERNIAPERVMASRYVLCTMLDESASETPWGGNGVWARHSLLAEFHNEASGGEKVFQLMARLAEKPDANRDLLELIYAAVALGFEGRYHVIDGGRAQLEAVRAKLAQIIMQQRGSYAPALAEHWQGAPLPPRKVLSWLPLSLAAVLAVALLGGIFTAFASSLADRSDPVLGQIQRLRLTPPVVAVTQPALQPRLAQFLQSDIKAGLVEVRDEVDRSVVSIRGDGLFAPASATLASDREALMQRIADALVRVGGPVLVTGHTDNTAIRSARFPSNFHLSEERARAVQKIVVAAGVPTDRVRAEGRADGEPVAPNDTPANKARNRRVDVTLFTARPDAASSGLPLSAPAPAPAASR